MIQIHCKSTNLDHRYALNKAANFYNKKNANKNIDIFVGTREITRVVVKKLFFSFKKDTFNIFYFTGLGRLYTDYWIFGKVLFSLLIKLCSLRKKCEFIVENPSDKLLIQRMTNKKIHLVNGSGFFENFPNPYGSDVIIKKSARLEKILYISRFGKSKYTDKIVELAKSIPEEITLIVGGYDIGRERFSEIFFKISKEKSNVRFTGKITSRIKYYQLLSETDIFVYPSKREGCPFSVLESVANNTLPIVSRTPGCSDLANNLGTPILNPEEFTNPTTLSDAYNNYFNKSGSGRVYIPNLKKYTADNIIKEFISIFNSV
tara:strand:- start:1733 stop:2686 length:954 start_codon:yes stop_codon:yes gene_type:complete